MPYTLPPVVPAGRLSSMAQPVLAAGGELVLRPWDVSDAGVLLDAAEVAYWTPPRARGLGVAHVALSALSRFTLGELGFPLVYRYGRYIHLDEKRLKVGQYLFLRHGGKIVFFGRFVAVLRAFAAFLAGVNRYNWEAFFLFNAAGGIVWATIFGVGGYLLGRAFEHYARPVGVAVLVVAVIGAIVGARFIRHHEEALEEEAERALPGPLVKPKA